MYVSYNFYNTMYHVKIQKKIIGKHDNLLTFKMDIFHQKMLEKIKIEKLPQKHYHFLKTYKHFVKKILVCI